MERIRKVGTTLRTHWKKSIFFTLASGYGVNWYLKKLEDTELMKNCCREALKYGSLTQGVHQQNYHVTVILNPAASGGKARKLFEKYSAPLLHLAGFKVSIQKTEGRDEAKALLNIMDNCDAVLVAGGDGTLMEAVTGLLKRTDLNHGGCQIPLAILPVGVDNRLASRLFPWEDQVKQLAEATMSVVRQLKRPVSVLEIENLTEEEELKGKKLYSMSGVDMGVWRDAGSRKDSYWFFWGLKHRLTYVFSYLTGHSEVAWHWPLTVSSVISQTVTRQVEDKSSRGGGGFSSLFSSAPKVVSVEDTVDTWQQPETLSAVGQVELRIRESELELKTYSDNFSFSEFVLEGWCRLKGWSELNPEPSHILKPEVRRSQQFLLETFASSESPRIMSVDGEEVDITGPLRVSILPDKVTMFCRQEEAVRPPTPAADSSTTRWSTRRSVTSNIMSGAAAGSIKQRF